MAQIYADRVHETTATTGTGTVNLAGAVAGYTDFITAIGTTNTCDYLLVSGIEWEVGNGTVTAGSPDTLSRDTVFDSSVGGGKITLAGVSNVYLTFAAYRWTNRFLSATFTGTTTFPGTTSFDTNGILHVGFGSVLNANGSLPQIQIYHNTSTAFSAALLIAEYGNDVEPPILFLGKSRGASPSFSAAVSIGDVIGEIDFVADDGVAGAGTLDVLSASVRAVAVATIGAAVVPAYLSLSTMNVAGVFAERMRLTSEGSLLIGNNTFVVNVGALSAVETVVTVGASASFARFSNDVTASYINVGKSRGSVATAGAVESGDNAFEIAVYGDDGSANGQINILGADYLVTVDGAVSAGVVPMRFAWRTMNVGGTIAERMRLTSAGGLNVGGTTDPGVGGIRSSNIQLRGATSGAITLQAAAVAGTAVITLPGGTTDFSATGGPSQVVKQSSLGAPLTVGQLATSDLSDVASIERMVMATKTVDYAVLTADTKTAFDNIGAAGNINLTLPAAARLLEFSACVMAAHNITFTANGTDTITLGNIVSAAGGTVVGSAVGSYITLRAHAAGGWIVSSMIGGWVVI